MKHFQQQQSFSEVSMEGPIVWASRELLQGRRELQIRHAGQTYRLQVTRTGKLILNK